MLFMSCVCHAGKMLTSWLLLVMSNCDFVTFPCGILGQVCYLIVLVPDLCRLSYFYNGRNAFATPAVSFLILSSLFL